MNKNPKILIVDDNTENLKVVGNFLKEKKYNIAFATGGKQAISATYETDFDLILLDIMMPDVDGYEICQKTKSDSKTSHIKIIFLTAKSKESDIAKGLEMGADAYITKPFTNKILLEQVKTILEK
jgi:DNA-binding response OmpR family regulator